MWRYLPCLRAVLPHRLQVRCLLSNLFVCQLEGFATAEAWELLAPGS